MKSVEKILTDYLDTIRDLSAAYLFGSVASGTANGTSDIDVGLLFQKGKQPSPERLLSMEDDLVSLSGKDVDVVVLNQASPVIRMQVLRKGKKIIEHSHHDTSDFFVRTVNEYDDLKRVRSIIEKNIVRGRIYG